MLARIKLKEPLRLKGQWLRLSFSSQLQVETYLRTIYHLKLKLIMYTTLDEILFCFDHFYSSCSRRKLFLTFFWFFFPHWQWTHTEPSQSYTFILQSSYFILESVFMRHSFKQWRKISVYHLLLLLIILLPACTGYTVIHWK